MSARLNLSHKRCLGILRVEAESRTAAFSVSRTFSKRGGNGKVFKAAFGIFNRYLACQTVSDCEWLEKQPDLDTDRIICLEIEAH